MRQAIRLRHYSPLIFFHAVRHPAEMGEAEITRFLSSLATDAKVSASTQNQALNALIFLYRAVLEQDVPWLDGLVRAKRPQRLPVVLARAEVRALLERLHGVPRRMALVLYGAGLRLLACCWLRVKDVDFAANQIVVRDGKGEKDRVTLLPAAVKADLARHLELVRQHHERDRQHGAGWVELPYALARKYSNAGRDLAWQWVFPATRLYVDRETGQRRRHHLHESVLQRAVNAAVRGAGILKPASCHTFRHCFATHLLEGGYDLPAGRQASGPSRNSWATRT